MKPYCEEMLRSSPVHRFLASSVTALLAANSVVLVVGFAGASDEVEAPTELVVITNPDGTQTLVDPTTPEGMRAIDEARRGGDTVESDAGDQAPSSPSTTAGEETSDRNRQNTPGTTLLDVGGTVGTLLDTVDRLVGETGDTADDTVRGTTDQIDDVVDGGTDTVDGTTGLDTGGAVDDQVDDTTDTVDSGVDTATDDTGDGVADTTDSVVDVVTEVSEDPLGTVGGL